MRTITIKRKGRQMKSWDVMKPIVMTLVRRVMVIGGTWLVVREYMTEQDMQTVLSHTEAIAGCVIVGASVIWSILKNNYLESKAR